VHLAVCGYPPADFLDKPSFVARTAEAVAEIAAAATGGKSLAVICGYVTAAPPGSGKPVVNSAALLRNGVVEFVQSKRLLPFYDVFDEQRYFAPAESQGLYSLGATGLRSRSAKTRGTTSCSGRAGFTPSIRSKN
jgi:NAD+ synthase (glutamine-hydrolysing)